MQATIRKIEQLTDDVKLFTLSLEESFSFIPGQFIMLSLKDNNGQVLKRAYSIASSPLQKNSIDLCIKILPDGKATQILNTLPVGTQLEIQGPYGKASFDKTKKYELILIANGCGIGAVRSILYDLFESKYDSPVWLFYGFRYDKDFLFKQEFSHFEEKYSTFHFIPIMSKPGQHSDPDIDVGHVDTVLPMYIIDASHKEVFICGSAPMAKGVITVLSKIGFSKEQIKTDAWS
ncbi:MAG: FAD-binding oxidoreductase [Candidatus Woesearchaeota archaeon]|jgi:NAD(P)H-flavin reductase